MKLSTLLCKGQKIEIWSSEGGACLLFAGYVEHLNGYRTPYINQDIKFLSSTTLDQIIIIL